jgi:putative transcriptional regulator
MPLAQFEIAPGDAPDVAVHRGGPVEPQRGFVLHSSDWGGQDTVHVADRWALTGTVDILRAIAGGTGPSRWLVALGYAGWGAGQLDGELTRHGWLNVTDDAALLFDTPVQDRWSRGMATLGIDPRLLASQSGTS